MKQNQLMLPLKSHRMMDGNLKTFPNYDKALRILKEHKPSYYHPTELQRMRKALDKLSPMYDDANNFGQHIIAKRIFKKATQISKRVTTLLGR